MSPVVRFGLVFGSTMALLSAPISGYFLTNMLLEARASSFWPNVEGIVKEVKVKEGDIDLPSGYSAEVVYWYEVEGANYSGKQIIKVDGASDEAEDVEQDLNVLQIGDPITVYYNPECRSKSVLEPGIPSPGWFILFGPAAMLVLGILGIRRAMAGKPRTRGWPR